MNRSIALLSFGLTALNTTAQASSVSGYNFFIGAQTALQNSIHRISNEDKTFAGTEKKDVHGHQLSGAIGVLAGIQFKTFSPWIWGMDVELSYSPNKVEESTTSIPAAGGNAFRPFKTNYKRDLSVGVGIKAGYSINKIVPYIRLGAEYSRFTHTFQGQTNVPVIDQLNLSQKRNAWGFAPGIGVDIPLTANERVLMNMEARYVFYSSKTIKGNSSSGLEGSSTVKPRFINLNIGVKVIL